MMLSLLKVKIEAFDFQNKQMNDVFLLPLLRRSQAESLKPQKHRRFSGFILIVGTMPRPIIKATEWSLDSSEGSRN